MKNVKFRAAVLHAYCPHCGEGLAMPGRDYVPGSLMWDITRTEDLADEHWGITCPDCGKKSLVRLPKLVALD